MKYKKILIVVLASHEGQYEFLANNIRNTWAKEAVDNIQIIYYYGDPNLDVDTKLIDDSLYVKQEETYWNIWYKTLKMFEYCYNNFEFDYIYRCCNSSFINQEKLLEFVEDKPLDNYYSGINGYDNGIAFASGSGYFISRNLLPIAFEPKNYNIPLIDDVALGTILSQYLSNDAIRIDLMNRGDVYNIPDIENRYHIHHFYELPHKFHGVPMQECLDWIREDFAYLYNLIYKK